MAFEPKYKHIAETLKRQIEAGLYSDGVLPSEYELGDQYNVSRTTVIRALDELRRLNLIYTVHGSGSYVCENVGLKNNPNFSNLVFVLLPFSGYERASRTDEIIILKSLENFLSKSGWFSIVHYCDDDCESFYESFKRLQSFPHEGIIIYPPQDADRILTEHPDVEKMLCSKPTVLIDQSIGNLNVTCVHPDYFKGGSLALKHLTDYGYTKYCFLTAASLNYNSSIRSRYEGFERALRKNGIKQSGTYIYIQSVDERMNVREDIDRYKDIIRKIAEQNRGERIGLFCYCDYMALKIYNACKELGYSVPEEIGIVGFGNMNLNLPDGKKLTTVDTEYRKCCRNAVKSLTEKIYKNGSCDTELKNDVALCIGNTTSEP